MSFISPSSFSVAAFTVLADGFCVSLLFFPAEAFSFASALSLSFDVAVPASVSVSFFISATPSSLTPYISSACLFTSSEGCRMSCAAFCQYAEQKLYFLRRFFNEPDITGILPDCSKLHDFRRCGYITDIFSPGLYCGQLYCLGRDLIYRNTPGSPCTAICCTFFVGSSIYRIYSGAFCTAANCTFSAGSLMEAMY